MKQTIITNGCLQIIYVNGTQKNQREALTKAYTECLDIYLVFEGELTLEIFGQTKILRNGDLFFCTRSTYNEIKHSEVPTSYARLRYIKDKLPGKTLPKRFAASLLHSDIILQKIFKHCLSFVEFYDSSLIQFSKEEAESIHEENVEIISILEIMLLQQHPCLDVIETDLNKNPLLVTAIDMFEDNIKSELMVKDITHSLGVSHSYFVRVFKRNMGVVPNVFWRTLKVNYSLSLISLKMDSLCDISYLLGFTDQSHFTNCFKKYLLTTPGSI